MKAPRSVGLFVLSGLVTLALLAGCARAQQVPPSTSTKQPAIVTTTTAPPAPAGPYGSLRVAVNTFGEQRMDPIRAGGNNIIALVSPTFDFLFGLDGAQVGPGIVDRWQMAPDALSWTFSVRKDVKFHDGTNMTAKDVKFGIDRQIGPDALNRNVASRVERVDLVGDDAIRVYTKTPQVFLLTYMFPGINGSPAVVPKDYIDKNGAEYFNSHPIGTGPFKFVRMVPGDNVEYEAVDKNWRQTSAFKKLNVILVPEPTTRLAALRTGEIDISDASMDTAAAMKAAGFKVVSTVFEETRVIFHGVYDTRAAKMPTANVKVRKALSLALNREEIKANFFQGLSGPPIIAHALPVKTDLDYDYWLDYAAKIYGYDPAEAKRLLAEAGYPNGISLKLFTFTQDGAPHLPKLAEVVQGYWAKIGVKAEIVATDDATWKAMGKYLKSPDIVGQAATNSAGPGPVPANRYDSYYHSKNSSWIFFSEAFPEVDKAIETALGDLDPTKRKEALAKVIRTVADSYQNLPIATVPSLYVVGPRVEINLPREVGLTLPYYWPMVTHAK